ncbi:endonuclease [Candidatus Saccharibacteria bacterium RIFCSPHIGHO2_12_FULL_41_12]|nr:MAG: endonuclease [Candidatus Saccharibacteria bacterium RIFCSPHIGHO2_12_FULL_41_12]
MNYYVYALQSESKNYIYVGMTSNLKRRIQQHNEGKSRSTKAYAPLRLVYSEMCGTGLEARKREKYLKSGVGKEFLKSLVYNR